MTDIVIVGAGTAGLTAAVYARRAGKSVLLIESDVYGGQITYSPRVENFPGFAAVSGSEFATKLLDQATALGAETEFPKVLAVRDENGVKTVVTDGGEFACKAVILATGGRHRKLGVAREDELAGAGVSYCAVCDGAFFKNRTVAVVGGGSAALQDAMFLSANCAKVYLIHRRDEFRGEETLAERLAERENVEFVLSATVRELLGEGTLSGVVVRTPEGERTLEVAGLFVAVGMAPDNAAFANLVDLDETGYIVAGEDCLTRTPGVYAAGDCRTKRIRQLTTAAGDGTVAALAACQYCDRV